MANAVLFSSAFGVDLRVAPPLPVATPYVMLTDRWTQAAPPTVRAGTIVTKASVGAVPYQGFWETFKNSLFLQPTKIDLGLVLSPSTHSVRVWSSYETSINATTITAIGTSGMSLTGRTTDVTLDAYGGYSDYTLNVSLAVSGVIDASYRWNFAGVAASVSTLSIVGQRIVVFGIPPQKRVTERLSWRTDVIRALDGSEQRLRIREKPLVSVRFKSVTGYHVTQGAEAMLYGLGYDALAIPVWHESIRLGGVVSPGTTKIDVDTAGSTFRVGDLLILWSDFYKYETGEISEITSTSVTLKKPVVGTWVKPVVAPLSYGLVDSADFSKYKINVSENSVEYTRNSNLDIPEAATYPLYSGLPVYGELLYSSGRSSSNAYAPSVQKLDFGIKARSQKKQFDFPDVTREILVKMHSPREALDFKKFLMYLGGRQKPFWYLSHWWDFLPVGEAPTTDAVIRVRDVGFLEYYTAAPTRKWLAIKPKSGDWVYRSIASVSKGSAIPGQPDNEALTLDTALPFTFSNDTVDRVCLMVPVRLDHDEVTLNWDGMQNITSSLRVREVTK